MPLSIFSSGSRWGYASWTWVSSASFGPCMRLSRNTKEWCVQVLVLRTPMKILIEQLKGSHPQLPVSCMPASCMPAVPNLLRWPFNICCLIISHILLLGCLWASQIKALWSINHYVLVPMLCVFKKSYLFSFLCYWDFQGFAQCALKLHRLLVDLQLLIGAANGINTSFLPLVATTLTKE